MRYLISTEVAMENCFDPIIFLKPASSRVPFLVIVSPKPDGEEYILAGYVVSYAA